MVFELGLLLATYVGSKLYDSRRAASRTPRAAPAPLQEDGERATPDVDESQDVGESKEDAEKRQLRYLKASMASMALFAVKPLVPGAVPLGLAAYLYGAVPYMKNVEKALVRDKKVNVDVLFFLADSLTLGMRNYFTAAFGLSMIHHGKYMVTKARDDSAKMVTHLFKELPQTVWLLVDEVEVEVALADVNVGDVVVVSAGGVIPVDGVIQKGIAQVDQRALTGESQPAEKGTDDPVFANTIVIMGELFIRVTRSGNDTTSAQIADMLLNSVSFKSGVQLKGEEWADKMTLPMLVSAAAIIPLKGTVSAVVFINAHIGSRILLFAPLVTLRHISEASKLGVLVKDGRALEQLCDVDTILFDKTGTLTTDQPEVAKVATNGSYSSREILTYAATAQRKLAHPIARAILKKAEEEGAHPYVVDDSNYTIGYGVSVALDGKHVHVGSVRFFEREGIEVPTDILEAQERSHARGNTFILVGIDRRAEGSLELQPQLRPDARALISQLRGFGIAHIGIVSGDERAPTKKLAEYLGMDSYFHNALPEDKAQIVEDLRAQGRVVCFVGDGINDSIALKKANVSMSIAGATSIAKDNAEIIFIDGSLTHMGAMVELAKRLEVNLQRSLMISLVPSAVNVLGAFVFDFSIMSALLVNSGCAAVGVTKVFYTREVTQPEIMPSPPAVVIRTDVPGNTVSMRPLDEEPEAISSKVNGVVVSALSETPREPR